MIGLVLVTHGRLAVEFRAALEHVVGPQSQIETVTIDPNDNVDALGHCEPLVQLKAGVGYMVIPRKFSISGALGYAWAVDHTEFGSLFADVYFNYHHRPWMFGAGLGYWNLDNTDYGDATLNLQGAIDLPWEIRDEPMQFVIEMRSFLDEISDFGNNYLLVGGFQFNF